MARKRTRKSPRAAKPGAEVKYSRPRKPAATPATPPASRAATRAAFWPTPGGAIAAVCVAAAVPGTFIGASIGFSDHYREVIAEVGFLGLLVVWLYRNRNLRRLTLHLSATRLWFAALMLLATLSVLWSNDLGFFTSKYFLWLAAAAALLATLTQKPDFALLIRIARGFSVIALYISAVGLAQALLGVDIFLQTHPPSANYHNKNAAMQVVVLCVPMIVFLLLFDRHKRLSVAYWFLLAMALAYTYHTRTRSAWLSLLMETLIIAAALLWQRGWLREAVRERRVNWGRAHKLAAVTSLLLLALLVNISASGWGGFIDRVSTVATTLQKDVASYAAETSGRRSERYKIWDSALKMVETRPAFGSGMGSFSHNLLTEPGRYKVWAPLRVHNDVLEVGVELGIAGVLLLLGAIFGLLAGLLRLFRHDDFTTRAFFLLVTAALGGSAVNMQFSFPYQMPLPLLLFAVYAGLIIRATDAANPRLKTVSLTLHRGHWLGGLGLAGALFALVLAVNLHWFNILFTADRNLTRPAWQNPVHLDPPLCHRGIVRLLFHLPSAYREAGRHSEIRGLQETIDRCVPGTWLSEQITISDLLRNKRWAEAIPHLERGVTLAPPGVYIDHINLLVAQLERKNLAGALEVYEVLNNEPTAQLIKRKNTLRTMTSFALQTDRREDARKYYRLHRKHYRLDEQYEATLPQWLRGEGEE